MDLDKMRGVIEAPDFAETVRLVESLSPEVQHLLLLVALRRAQRIVGGALGFVAGVSSMPRGRVPAARPFYRRGRW